MKMRSLEEVIACPALPSLPAVATRVIDLTSDPEVRLDEIADVVQNDQALASKILRTVNSSYYSLSKPCPSISRAMAYLGLNTVKSLTLGFSLVDLTRRSEGGLDLTGFWRHSAYSAASARRVGLLTSACDPEDAFLAGLMQDIGMLAMHAAMPEDYHQVVKRAEGNHARLADIELDVLGFDHCQVGQELGRRWRFPQQLVDPIRHHHSGQAGTFHDNDVIKAVVLGNYIASSIQHHDSVSLNRLFRSASRFFSLVAQNVKGLVLASAEDAVNLARLLGVKIGAPPADVRSIMARADDARIKHQLGLEKETEELKQTNVELARQTVTDALTGVGNRGRFDRVIDQEFQDSFIRGLPLGVILVDADRFKALNDTHGHPAGDAVLVEIARRMKETVGKAGAVCRYGGEEFAAILPATSRLAAAKMAEQVRREIARRPFDLTSVDGGSGSVEVTISLGVAVHEPSGSKAFVRPQLLVQAADRALYAAKNSGRNCVRVFVPRPAGRQSA